MSRLIIPLIISMFLIPAACSPGEKEALEEYSQTFSTIQREFNTSILKVTSQKEYNDLQQTRAKRLTQLLARFPSATQLLETTVLKARIQVNLNRIKEAQALITPLLNREEEPPAAPAMVQVLIHMANRHNDEALKVFRKIENHPLDASDRFNAYLFFSMVGSDMEIRREFALKFVQSPGIPEHFNLFRANAFQQLAQMDLENKKYDAARNWLDKAIEASRDPAMTQSLQSEKDRMRLLGTPAMELDAGTWFNGSSVRLSRLKGSVVLIDFWAPWCNPCRMVIPELVSMYKEFHSRGLEIIGLTRLHGFYRDDQVNRGKVTAAEEVRLIRDFVQRNGITYPVAVSREGRSFEKYLISGIPTMVLIDRNGRIASIKVGAGRPASLRRAIESLLEETP